MLRSSYSNISNIYHSQIYTVPFQFGFKQRKSTGLIDRSEAYGRGGRYLLGPDYSFKPLRADAHFETFNRVSIFAKDRLQVSALIEFIQFYVAGKIYQH